MGQSSPSVPNRLRQGVCLLSILSLEIAEAVREGIARQLDG